DEDVLAREEGGAREVVVRRGRRRDDDGVDGRIGEESRRALGGEDVGGAVAGGGEGGGGEVGDVDGADAAGALEGPEPVEAPGAAAEEAHADVAHRGGW